MTFQQISEYVEHSFAYPSTLNEESKAIISGFLNKDPLKRLGSGAKDSQYGYPILKQHAFFSTHTTGEGYQGDVVDDSTKPLVWDNLFGQAAPSIPPLLELEEPTRDGTTLNFSLYDVEDELEGMSISSVSNNADANGKSNASLGKTPSSQDMENTFLGFLMPGESVFHSGILTKRRYFSVKTRFFMLIHGGAEPRLIYIDPEKKELKGEIPWSHEIETEVISPFKFDIVTAERTYHLSSEKEDSILGWVQAVREAKGMRS